MLKIYKSNRAEWLADILSEELRLHPPTPFETVDVLVNTWPTSRWLNEKLAAKNGITALVDFPFPSAYLKKLARSILGYGENNKDHWKAKSLIWEILELLPEILQDKKASLLRQWLEKYNSNSDLLTKTKWNLAKRIADAFEDYSIYRGEILEEWSKISSHNDKKKEEAEDPYEWQCLLTKILVKTINEEPFSWLADKAIKKLKDNSHSHERLPNKIYIFGISTLAPSQIKLIKAISGLIDVTIFLITPCPELWQRLKTKRDEVESKLANRSEKEVSWQLTGLDSNLGRMGGEFQQLLEGIGEDQLGEIQENNLFADTSSIANTKKRDANLLEQLQKQLVESNLNVKLKREIEDNSIQFFACSSRIREAQIIRDQILQLFAKDNKLEPKDILIMTPNIEQFAPIIHSIFNDSSATDVEFPWRITDRSQQEERTGVTQFIIQLLEVANTSLNATSLDLLISNPALMQKQNLSQEEIRLINKQLQYTGFTWGLDKKERNGDEIHSLTWCLERWLLGLVMPYQDGKSYGGLVPYSEGINYQQIKKWWNLLTTIKDILLRFKKPRKCSEWIDSLKLSMYKFFENEGDLDWEINRINGILEDWRVNAEKYECPIEASVVSEIIKEGCKAECGRFGHRSGKVTISALEPMRAIPHKVIILMGLDAKSFPRRKDRPSFHLMEQKKLLGDPSTTDKDKYSLLEALISARQNLFISWRNKEERSGEDLPPCGPVLQLINSLERSLGSAQMKSIVRIAPPNPLSIKNFIKIENNQPFSCDKRNLEARSFLDKKKKPKDLGLAIPISWDSSSIPNKIIRSNELLRKWLISPQRMWLEGLEIKPIEWNQKLKNHESFDLNNYERNNMISEKLYKTLEGKENLDGSWIERYSKEGKIPIGAEGILEAEILENRWESLITVISNLGKCKKVGLGLHPDSSESWWAGNYLVVIDIGELGHKSLMEAWFQHLHSCMNGKKPEYTLVISRMSRQAKIDKYEVSLKLNPLEKEDAGLELTKLRTIASKGMKKCWPVPPKSGWAITNAKIKRSKFEERVFKNTWNGSLVSKGERDSEVMKLCFGRHTEWDNFLNNDDFKSAYSSLYSPILRCIS